MEQTRLTELIEPVVEGLGYELWGCEYVPRRRQSLLRIYIDRRDGITLDDCGRVSHQLSGVLNVEDPIGGAYILEVSSPGLDRLLLKAEHFQRYCGHRVRVRLKWLIDGRRQFDARLHDVEGGRVRVVEQEKAYVIPLAAIDRARLVPDTGMYQTKARHE
ncbi:MAG: ribosome maturation factor RimP [Gammaproteobacteria bacterium]|nr:ribosome maturation factor RimP [Gammaproteobacteria bacterium]MBA3730827.1 ribosome maturation factor RimP [Gammaproteobacteria bacterium]